MSLGEARAPLVQMPEPQIMGVVRAEEVAESRDPTPELSGPPLSKCLACLCCPNPAMWLGCCTQVEQNQQQALLYWGKYTGTLQEPGFVCGLNPCGREVRKISTKYNTIELKDIKVVDAKGNPVCISGVVTYCLTSAKKACVDVENPIRYLELQATTVLRQVASRYPYGAPAGQPSLQSMGPLISTELISTLQPKADIPGARIANFEIVDLSYAPEIAQVMLARQQAEALVEARRLIVSSAVDMAHQAVAQLEAKGCNMSDDARERLTTNLMSVICSHTSATPTIPLR